MRPPPADRDAGCHGALTTRTHPGSDQSLRSLARAPSSFNPAIYAIARGPAYHRAFHDVVTGDNSVLWPTGVFTGYNAGPGWDPVTGWGSPDAQYLVPLLAHAPHSGA